MSGGIEVFMLIPIDGAYVFANTERLFVDQVEGLTAGQYMKAQS